jgi:NodT family efflux transporter outer membrane factor (OMF) lipoprotein
LQLRVSDAERDLISRSAQGYEKALALTRSQYRAGIVTQADVALAETQLRSAQAQAIDLGIARSQLEHAIAFLTGRTPAEVSIAVRPSGQLGVTLPDTPAALPSQLLQRRPDIAAAERRAAAANANIGVAQAAYFPSLSLSASGGIAGASLAQLANAPARVWSLGAGLAQLLFDGGARRAQTEEATAAFDAAAAQYKRSVLAGLQEVEDNLAQLRILAEERGVQDAAVASARNAERVSLAQYRAGTTSFLSVVTAQNLALGNERSALQLLGRQLAASAALVKALGGGWNAAELDTAAAAAATNAAPSGS